MGYQALNPKGTVPTLRDGPVVLNESNTIVAYLCQKYGKQAGLYPDSAPALALAWQWLEYAETTIAEAQAPIFFPIVRGIPYPFGSDAKCPDKVKALAPALEKAISGLDEHLAGKQYVLGDALTMADITAGVQANRLFTNNGYGFPELHPSRFPSISEWLKRLAARPAF